MGQGLFERRAWEYDLLVIGGGINGCAIARDAAGRGLSTRLVEQHDLASGTSSASTKLIHGGLRYLELREFRLVREALVEREVLLAAAPHVIWPMTFVLPHEKGLRPIWMPATSGYLFTTISRVASASKARIWRGSKAPPSARRCGTPTPSASPIRTAGLTICDSVVINALDAKERGATIDVNARLDPCDLRERTAGLATLESGETIVARALVNAAGPWVSQVGDGALHLSTRKRVSASLKGSHIVTRRLYDGEQAYILQNADGRIVFVIPYEHDFTLIGTTDVPPSRAHRGR